MYFVLGRQIVTWQQNLMLISFIIIMKLKFNKYYEVWDRDFNVLILQYNIYMNLLSYAYKKKYSFVYLPYLYYLLILEYYKMHDTCALFISLSYYLINVKILKKFCQYI